MSSPFVHRGKNGDPSSSFLQVLQKLYRRQYLEEKIELENSSTQAKRKAFMAAYRIRQSAARARAARELKKEKEKSKQQVV